MFRCSVEHHVNLRRTGADKFVYCTWDYHRSNSSRKISFKARQLCPYNFSIIEESVVQLNFVHIC